MERGNGIIVVPVSIVIDKTRAIVEIDICRNLSPLCSAALLSHGPTVIFKIARSLSGFIKFPGLTSNPVHRSPWIFYLSRVFEYRILSTENFEGKSFLQFWLVFLSIFLFFLELLFLFILLNFIHWSDRFSFRFFWYLISLKLKFQFSFPEFYSRTLINFPWTIDKYFP